MELSKIEQEIIYFDNIISKKEFDAYTYSKKRQIIASWLKLKYQRNKIIKYPLSERVKLKTISKTFGFIDDLDELKTKSKSQWIKARAKARKLFKSKGIVKE